MQMPINVGILGLAHGHVGVYCDQWQNMPDKPIRIAGAWDSDPQRAAAAREKYKLRVFESSGDLLLDPAIEAVVIGAETAYHADLVEAAAAARKKIILQKPLALTMEQGDRIVADVERQEVPFTLAWQMRVDPQNLEMKHLILNGTLGRIYMVRRRHGLSTHLWPGFESTWHVQPELNRGMWADDACHAIDFLLWLLGKPQNVVAEIATLRSAKVPDDNGIAIFRYDNGTFAEVVSSFVCVAGENTTEIVGEEGVIIQNYGDGPSAQVPRPSDAAGLKWFLKGQKAWFRSATPSPASHGERIAALAPELAKFLLGERPPICTAEEGRASLAMTLACYRSAELGRRVRISEIENAIR
jgi:predicted dehydrogenase